MALHALDRFGLFLYVAYAVAIHHFIGIEDR